MTGSDVCSSDLDYQALLDDENVDAVYLPLPNGVHKEWVLKAAAAGKHILCEKPMSLTEADVREMFAAAKAHGVLLEEAYAYRHAQLAQKVKEIVDSGAIGRIRYIESKHSTYDTNRSGIRYQKGNGGGAVYDVTMEWSVRVYLSIPMKSFHCTE